MDNDIDSKKVWGIFRFPFVTHFMSVSLRKSRSWFDFLVLNAIIPLIRDITHRIHSWYFSRSLVEWSMKIPSGYTPWGRYPVDYGDTRRHMQLQCIVLESPFSYCAETLLKEKKISLRWTVISAPVPRIIKNKVQAYLTLTPRAIGRNIVGHNSQHCWMLQVASVCTPSCMLGYQFRFLGNCPPTPPLS